MKMFISYTILDTIELDKNPDNNETEEIIENSINNLGLDNIYINDISYEIINN